MNLHTDRSRDTQTHMSHVALRLTPHARGALERLSADESLSLSRTRACARSLARSQRSRGAPPLARAAAEEVKSFEARYAARLEAR